MQSVETFNLQSQAIHHISQTDFRSGMARLGAAVHIITTDGPAGRCGFTASAVCSVTDTPPTLLVCVNRNAASLQALQRNGVLCVNTLAGTHQSISKAFSSKVPMEERFASAEWTRGKSGAPVLSDSIISFDCRVANTIEVGTHTVFFCEVCGLHQGDKEEALIYFARAYHRLTALTSLED